MISKSQKFLGILIVFFSTTLGHAESKDRAESIEPPRSMAALGDSITAGAVAQYSRDQVWHPKFGFLFAGSLIRLLLHRNTRAAEDRRLSWATGYDPSYKVHSHASKLRYWNKKQGYRFRAYNASQSGHETRHLDEQVSDVLNWSERRLKQAAPDYITILMGANDVCAKDTESMFTTREVYDNTIRAIDRLLRANANSKILLSSVPDVITLRDVAKDSRVLGFGRLKTCQEVWELVNYCHTLMIEDRPEERAKIAQRVEDYNQAYVSIAETINREHGSERVRVAQSVYESKFSDQDLSIDCFHPNFRGQEMIAGKTWNESWWGENWAQMESGYTKAWKREKRRKRRRRQHHR